MRATIGEIINVILPYSNDIIINSMNSFPYIRARLNSKFGFTKCYLYILQVDEYIYSACDNSENSNGELCFPTGNSDNPFIKEKDFVTRWIGGDCYDEEINISKNMSCYEFMEYFYSLLFEYEIVKTNPKILTQNMNGIKFPSKKIISCISDTMHSNKCNKLTILEMIYIIRIHMNSLSLENLKLKEINEFISTMKKLGIIIKMKDKNIIDIFIEKI